MDKADNIKKQTLFNELFKCFNALRGYADLNSLLMPLLYVLCAHHEGHLVSLVGDGPNIFKGDKHIQPLLDADMNDVESDLLKRIRHSVDERYFRGKTVQVIYDFYSRCNKLITEFYPELIEYIFSQYSKSTGKFSGMFASPKEVTSLMYSLALQHKPTSIYDPCAGLCSGMILPKMNDVKFIGQEINPQIKLFADIRLLAHNKKASIYCENSLDIWRGNEAECLCADFPIGLRIYKEFNGVQKQMMFEDAIIWKFIETTSLKKAVVLVPIRFCWDNKNFDLRKTLCEKNYVDTVIELPKGVLSYTGIKTAIVVLDKERSTREVNFVSAAGDFSSNVISSRNEKTLDVKNLLWRLQVKSDEQMAVCDIEETFRHTCSLLPSEYIKSNVELQAGQKLVKFIDLASEIRNTRYKDTEGQILTEKQMCKSIAEFLTLDSRIKSKSFDEHKYNKLTKPCIIFNLRADKFYIKYDEIPLFVSVNYRAFEVNTKKCLPEYLVLSMLKSKDLVQASTRGIATPRIDYKSLHLPIYENLDTQKQIIEREYRQEAKQLRIKLERLQTLSGQSSDLLHNLGVTFTRLDAAVANLQSQHNNEVDKLLVNSPNESNDPMASTIKVLDDNVKFALRMIDSTGTDFSKVVPIRKKVVLQEIVEKYISAWENFGYASFSLLPLKSSIPQTKVEVDVDMLYTALDCIFINAHQHGFNKRDSENNHVLVELKAVTIKDEKYALISVSNNGDPLPDGFTLKDFAARGYVGLNSSQDGLGGHHVASIAHLHDGFVSIESSSEWLSFNILIPTYINAKDTIFDEYEYEYL